MQGQQPLCYLWSSSPATTLPASDHLRHNTSSVSMPLPMSDVPGVKNRNLTPGGRRASTATRSAANYLDQRSQSNDFHLHRPTYSHSFHTVTFPQPLCLTSDVLYDIHPASEQPSSFVCDETSSTTSKFIDFPTLVNATTPLDPLVASSRPRNLRSLTTSFDVDPVIMTSLAEMPGSPPELSESRSSKSSSYGSHPSSPEDICTGIINFEDIGLDDDKVDTADASETPQNGRRKNKNSAAHNGGPSRPSLATIQTESKPYFRSKDNGVKSAGIAPVKRGFTTPAIMSMRFTEPQSRTRSSSPPKKHVPRSVSAMGKSGPNTSLALPPRRGSWQPARKTVKEIEAEYHDSDDELPDDASLFNVPVSPFPSWTRSARSSAQGSPEREISAQSPRPIPLAHAKTAPESPPRQQAPSQTLPRNRLTPRSSSTNLSKSIPSSPQTRFMRNGRAKSWNLAMSDLNHEARIIAEKLEHHCDSGTSEDVVASHRSSAPGAILLPPIQTGTIDFMPMSKEKQAILSRTRPSWLPPKDPEEEKRHLKEYQRMMKASLEAEKRKEEKLKQIRCDQDNTRASLNRIWTYFLDPTTDITIIDKRVHDLCWRGIPSKLRGKVWQRNVGNPLGLTATSFEKALQRAEEAKSKATDERTDQEKNMIAWFADIERDAETAFPELNVFQRGGPLRQDLINVCEAYTAYRSDIGYIYGLQLVAAILLLQLPHPAEVFILLANCLNKPMPLAFQTRDVEAVRRSYMKVMSTLEIKFPRLHNYLFASHECGGLGFRGEELFEPMFRTLFANGLDADRLCRVWDIWIFEGDRSLIRTAVALLGCLQSQIFDIQGDLHLKRRNIQEMLGWGPFNRSQHGYWKLNLHGDEEAFVAEISNASRLDHTGR